MKDRIKLRKKKSGCLQRGICFLLLLTMLCSCGTEKASVSEKKDGTDYLEQCETIKKYEEKYSMEQINVAYEEKSEYAAIKDESTILGYVADLHLKCDADIMEEDIAKLACEEMSVYIYNSEGEADIAECLVLVNVEGKEEQHMRLRFSDKTRGEYVVYLSEKAEGEPAYRIKSGITEKMIFYTETGIDECNFELSGQVGKLTGMSAKNEVTILEKMEDEELYERLKEHIKGIQDVMKETQAEVRIEYIFDVYCEGKKYKTITMRASDKELRDWKVIS